MPVATVTVQELRPPAADKKRGRIVDVSGTLYQSSPELQATMKVGQNYNVTYKDDEYNGVAFRVAESAVLVASQAVPYVPAKTAQANPAPRSSYGATDMATAERIFVCGALNAILSNQNVVPGDLTAAKMIATVHIIRTAWLNTFGGQGADPEMGDEIPYR